MFRYFSAVVSGYKKRQHFYFYYYDSAVCYSVTVQCGTVWQYSVLQCDCDSVTNASHL